jgi:hypothetical protein
MTDLDREETEDHEIIEFQRVTQADRHHALERHSIAVHRRLRWTHRR